MDEIMTIRTIESFLGFIIFMLGITFIAFMLQFISNVIIIKELPTIKKYTQRIFEKLYGFEETPTTNQNNDKQQEQVKNKTCLIISGIIVGIIFVAIILTILVVLELFF